MLAQVNTGELRLKVTDPAGRGMKASVAVSRGGNGYREGFSTDDSGGVDIKTLAYGVYLVSAEKQGFAPAWVTVEIRSELPTRLAIQLAISPVNTSVQVRASAPLIDPYRPSSVMQIGAQQIQERVTYLPGRSVQDLVNSQPGWLYEGNAVLHPRGSEYQTQFVIDGMPLTDNRSPSFGPEIEADDRGIHEHLHRGIPAEYGRKMGGVVELEYPTQTRDRISRASRGLSGGSYDTAGGIRPGPVVWGRNTARRQRSGRHVTRTISIRWCRRTTPTAEPPAISPQTISAI